MTDLKEDGRVPAAPGSCPTGQAAARLDAPRFDPSRDKCWGPEIDTIAGCPKWLAYQEPFVWLKTREWLGHTRARCIYTPPFARSTREWYWRTRDGKPNIVAIRLPADHPAYRDSDGNPEGGDGTAPSRSDDSAGGAAASPSTSQDQSHDG